MNRLSNRWVVAIAALAVTAVVTVLGASPARSATTPADAIKYRKAVMDALGGHVAAFALVNFGRVEHQDHLKQHANALADLGAQVKVLFPAGSDSGNTDALPKIWAEPAKFQQAVDAMEKSSAQLRDAVAAGNKGGIAQGFKAIGEACKGCHDDFRKETKKQ